MKYIGPVTDQYKCMYGACNTDWGRGTSLRVSQILLYLSVGEEFSISEKDLGL
jgi:hypothetical protein